MRSICVFAGASPGARPAYREAAVALGKELAARGYGLVYGGGEVGLMGALANAVLQAGGQVLGVIPESIASKEVAHGSLSELVVVDSMHQRKQLMADRSDGVVALPGGLGTLEELLEMLTWAQLGIHGKPCAVLNVAGYYDRLLEFLSFANNERFIHDAHRAMLLADDCPARLLAAMEAYVPPAQDKWLDRDQR